MDTQTKRNIQKHFKVKSNYQYYQFQVHEMFILNKCYRIK